jgi:hypothetical protein
VKYATNKLITPTARLSWADRASVGSQALSSPHSFRPLSIHAQPSYLPYIGIQDFVTYARAVVCCEQSPSLPGLQMTGGTARYSRPTFQHNPLLHTFLRVRQKAVLTNAGALDDPLALALHNTRRYALHAEGHICMASSCPTLWRSLRGQP